MYDIGIGDLVIIQDDAVYGGLSSDRGKKVPKSQLFPTTHTVTSIKPHFGEQEVHLAEINSWVPVRFLSLENGYLETNTVIGIVDQNSGMDETDGNITFLGYFLIAIWLFILISELIKAIYKNANSANKKMR